MPVSLSVPTLVIEAVIFLATVFILERWVFTPIRTVWAERERRVQEGLASAGESQEGAQEARAEVQRILNEARRRSAAQIEEATARANQTRDTLVARATEEFRGLVDEARGRIGAERERTAAALQDRVVDLALLAASQVTGQSYNQASVRQLAAAVVERESLT
ncbi:MAG: F0F1 ATP synthase subunit B [Chloroflexota bacterium]